jgi:hypothetical protein
MVWRFFGCAGRMAGVEVEVECVTGCVFIFHFYADEGPWTAFRYLYERIEVSR